MASSRQLLAVAAVKTVNGLSRLTGRGAGTVVGGRVGLSLDPQLLAKLSVGREIILVSGTNGKTTTTAFLAAGWGGALSNDTGSNMAPGLVATLASASTTRVVLEVDEAWLPRVLASLRPHVVVLLNLSRDQLDRGAEVRVVAEKWRVALTSFTGTIVANACDPLVVAAVDAHPSVKWVSVPTPWREDSLSCPRCTHILSSAADGWSCTCGFRQPTAAATLATELEVNGVEYPVTLNIPGEFNRSNASLAAVALNEFGVPYSTSLQNMLTIHGVAGRYTLRSLQGRRMRLLLAKNPAGFAAAFEALPPGDEPLYIAINARVADGLDPSWLYDVPFELLRGRLVYCAGDRALDLATRLHYAGVSATLSAPPTVDIDMWAIANYTAFADWLRESSPC